MPHPAINPLCDLHSLCAPSTVTLDASSEDAMCFSPSGVLLENTIEWVAYEQPTFISQCWKPKIMAPADSVSDECLLVGSQRAILSLCAHVVGGQGSSVRSFIRALIPFVRIPLSCLKHLPKAPRLHTLHWGLGFKV